MGEVCRRILRLDERGGLVEWPLEISRDDSRSMV